tara:strand:+ start:949 stop:1308 length:360 start_codon:yes stop_codon:yes gene_type:complete
MEKIVKIRDLSFKLKKSDINEILASHFEPMGYKITKKLIDVKVRKNAFVAARVFRDDNWEDNDIDLYIEGYTPNFGARFLTILLLPWIFFYFEQRKFVKEIYEYLNSKQFLDDAMKFKH